MHIKEWENVKLLSVYFKHDSKSYFNYIKVASEIIGVERVCNILQNETHQIRKDLISQILEPYVLQRCDYCDEWYFRRNNTKYCGSTCKTRHKQHIKITKERLKKFNVIGEFHEDITLPKLYADDEKKCYICGCETDITLDVNDDKYPNIEHVIPISKGGTHTWDNVRLSCRRCNMDKGVN